MNQVMRCQCNWTCIVSIIIVLQSVLSRAGTQLIMGQSVSPINIVILHCYKIEPLIFHLSGGLFSTSFVCRPTLLL